MSAPFDHQVMGAQWLRERTRALLGDDPGLGKTRTLLLAALSTGCTTPTVVCPAIVRTHWRREGEAMGMRPRVFSYDEATAGKLHAQGLAGGDVLLLDEAHYLKNHEARRTSVILGRAGVTRGYGRVYGASGTIMPKHPGELWTILSALFPAVVQRHGIRTRRGWLDRFCVTEPRYFRGRSVEKVVGVQNVEELRDILGEVMLARTLADVGLDVPRVWWQTWRFDIDQKARTEVNNAVNAIPSEVWMGGFESNIANLADIKNDPYVTRMRRRIGEIKAPLVADSLAQQLDGSDEKVVVFAHHRAVLACLRETFENADLSPAYVDGDTLVRQRDAEIDGFQSDPNCRVFLGQNIACQTGITLHAAHRVVLVEPDWTRTVNEQLAARVARIGQTADRCIAQVACLAGTLDEAIVGQNLRELRMQREVMAA